MTEGRAIASPPLSFSVNIKETHCVIAINGRRKEKKRRKKKKRKKKEEEEEKHTPYHEDIKKVMDKAGRERREYSN